MRTGILLELDLSRSTTAANELRAHDAGMFRWMSILGVQEYTFSLITSLGLGASLS